MTISQIRKSNSIFQILSTMGSCCSSLCVDSSKCYERWRKIWEVIKPQSTCDYIIFPFCSLYYGGLFIISVVISFVVFGTLGLTGFGRCWGKGFLKKLHERSKPTVSAGGESMESPNLEACGYDEFVMVERPK